MDTPESCNRWANGTSHTPASFSASFSCVDGGSTYYQGGSNGVCNTAGSTDNLVASYNQVGSITRSYPNHSTSTCTVQGRYATPDYSGPSISVNSVEGVFTSDNNEWCNVTRYLSGDATRTGCNYYAGRTAHAAGTTPDLLEGLGFSVSDTSGISSIRVELGGCDATYGSEAFNTDVGSIVQSASSASGVKPAYQSTAIKYNQVSVNAAGAPGA